MAVLKSTLKLSLLDDVSARARKITGVLNGLRRQTSVLNSTFGRIAAFGAGYIGITTGLENTYTAAADAQAALTEIGIKAGLSQTQLGQMQQRLAQLAPSVNQFTKDLTAGVDTMLTMGVGADQAMGSIGAIGKAATATGATITDLSAASVSAMQNLKVMPSEIQQMLDGMTAAGNAGAFEMKDMASYFPQLTASAQSLGIKGVAGVNDLAAALQIARRGAGDASTAANNMANFMGKIMSPDVIKNFKKFGVDVTKELKKAQKQGISPIEHFIKLVDEKTKGGQADLLGQLFGDQQVKDFIRPMLADFKDYIRIRDEANRANGTVADAYGRRMEDANQKVKSLGISLQKLAESFGRNLLQPVANFADRISYALNTLDERAGIFQQIRTAGDGFLSGFGGANGLSDASKSWEDFIFGVRDGSKAADDVGRVFARFQEYGKSVRELSDAVRNSPAATFLTELGVAIAGLGLSKWFRLFAVAAGIKAVIDAAREAGSVREFVDNLKGLSALEWAGVGAGLLMIASRAKTAVGWFKELKNVTPKATPTVETSAKPSAFPPGAFSLKNIIGGVFKGGAQALLGYLGETGIRKGFQGVYGDKYVEPPDMATSIDNTWAAWRNLFSGAGGGSAEGVWSGKRALGYNPLMDAVDSSQSPVKIDPASISEMTQPRGTQDVRVTNAQPVNVNVSVNQVISGSGDPKAVGDEAASRVGAKTKAAVESSFGGGGF